MDSSANSSSVLFKLDSTDPSVNIIYPSDDLNVSSNSIDFNATASDGLASSLTYYWIVNGTLNSTSVDSNSTFNASDGYYNLTLLVSDGLNNGSDTVLFALDTTAPLVSITTPLDDTIAGWNVLLQAEITDLTSVVSASYQIRNGTLSDAIIYNGSLGLLSEDVYNATFATNETWPYSNSLLNSTNLTLVVIANDTLGNEANASTYFVLDNSKPGIQYVTPLATGEFVNENFSLSVYLSNHKLNYSFVNISLDGVTAYYNSTSLDVGTYYWTDLVNVTGLSEGNYSVSVYANDTQGNNRTTSSWFYVDKTAPNASLAGSVGGWVNPTPDNGTFTNVVLQIFNMSCNETISSINDVWINLSNGTKYSTESGSSGVYYWFSVSLNEGSYNYTGYCNDSVGNLGSTETRGLTVDTTYPTWQDNKTNLTSSTPSGSTVYFNITLNSSNPDKYIFSWYNGSDWVNDTPTSYTNGQEIEVLKNISISSGDINWTGYFNDTAGNMNQTDVWSITILSSSISLSMIYPTANINVTQNEFFNVTAQVCCYDSDCGEINTTLSLNGTLNYTNTTGLITQDSDLGNDTIAASVENAPDESKEDAFDQNTGTKWLTLNENTGWIIIELGNGAQRMWKYEICSANDASTRDPDNWIIEGSIDNSSWAVLDTVISNGQFASRETCYTFYPDSIGSYKYYKMNVTQNNGAEHMQMSEIKFYQQNSTRDPVISEDSGTPFYTNVTNPYNMSLSKDECSNITWFLNATGSTGSKNPIFAYANKTSNMKISNITSSFNITILECLVDGDCSGDNNCLSGTCTAPPDIIFPSISFSLPTPTNATSQAENNVEINITINETNLDTIKYNWNGTNYTMYNDSLVLLMNFDNMSELGENNTYAVDISSYGNDAVIDGPTWNSSGKYGGTFEFDGVDDFINISDDSSLDVTNELTIMFWIKGTNPADYSAIPIAHGTYGDSFWFELYNLDTGMQFYVNIDGVGARGNNNKFNISSDTWTHVTGTFDGQYIRVYVNGTLYDSKAQAGSIAVSNTPLYMGLSDGDTWGGHYFNGSLDEVMIWNISLSDDEIYSHYISSLKKVGTDSWELYVNQSKNATDGLSDGDYTYQAFAKDDAGNLNYTETRTVIINTTDTTLPTYTNLANNGSTVTRVNGVVNWSVTLADDIGLSNYYFAHNQTGTLENQSLKILSEDSQFVNETLSITLTQGNYVCGQYWFNDTSNNVNQTGLSCFTVANSAPAVPSVIYPVDGNNYTDIPYINYSSSDADADSLTYNVYINGSLNVSSSVNITSWNASDGYYNLTVSASDGINSSANSSSVLFKLDSTAPSVDVVYPSDGLNVSSNSIDFNATASDGLASSLTYYWIVNGTLNSTSVDSNSTFNASDGYYNLTLFVSDGLNNGSDTVMFALDTTAPLVSIATPLDDTIAGWNVLLQASISDMISLDGVTFEIRNGTLSDAIIYNGSLGLLSGGVYNATFATNETWPYSNSLLNNTNLTLVVIANDTLGNTANDSTYFVLDNSKPGIQYVTPLATGGFVNENFSLSVYLSNHKLNYSFVNISLDGVTAYYNSTSLDVGTYYWTDLVNVTGLSEGNYTISVYANDTQSNNRTTTSWFYVDKTAPNASLAGSVGGWVSPTPDNGTITSTTTQTFNMSCNETISSINSVWINLSNGTSYNTETGSSGVYYWFNLTLNDGTYNYTGYCN
jgi:uncharacterized membrane protein